ncbi:hypothetical protein GBF38_006183 [Nibea albiflora]|uniref:Uncharacterized protein n=1 Tax=Nibea albiflora TaxID=240163 RepID=A0ACB7FA90_NIBAL|nr:hypothetical protein GBF38_006183 [Nibea albiflora]
MEGRPSRGRGGSWRRGGGGGRGGSDGSESSGGEHRGRGRGGHHRGRGKRDHYRGRGRGGWSSSSSGGGGHASELNHRDQNEGDGFQEEDGRTEVFSRRKLESNWDRYKESEKEEPGDDAPTHRGADYHVLLESAAATGSSEKSPTAHRALHVQRQTTANVSDSLEDIVELLAPKQPDV